MKYIDMEKAKQYYKRFIYQLKAFYDNVPNIELDEFITIFSSTQGDRIIWHLKTFRSITSSISKIYGIQYCSSAIRDAEKKLENSEYFIERREGIETNWLTHKNTRYTEYVLQDKLGAIV